MNSMTFIMQLKLNLGILDRVVAKEGTVARRRKGGSEVKIKRKGR